MVGQIIAVVLLGLTALNDIKRKEVSPIIFMLFIGILVGYSFFTVSFQPILNFMVGYAITTFIAFGLSKANVDFGGGDAKIVALVSGFTSPILGVVALLVAMFFWRLAKYPERVAFIPYLMTAFTIVCLFSTRLCIGLL